MTGPLNNALEESCLIMSCENDWRTALLWDCNTSTVGAKTAVLGSGASHTSARHYMSILLYVGSVSVVSMYVCRAVMYCKSCDIV